MHMDMDAFFASVEQMDAPELRGKPVIVGNGARGVVCAASYEARRFGVHSAMPVGQARRLCPGGFFVPGRMSRYAEISRIVQQVLQDFSPRVEQASVDEAYLDATGLERIFGPVDALGRAVKQAVREATGGLTCSVGLAPVKFLAKIASDMDKPDGLTILSADAVPAFLAALPVGTLPGVGKRFGEELARLGVRTCAQVRDYPQTFWERRFGKAGLCLYERAAGLDRREVVPFTPPKSESAETTLAQDTLDRTLLKDWLFRHADRVGRGLRRQKLRGRVVTVKIKFADFTLITRRQTLPEPTCATRTIFECACALLDAEPLPQKVRLIGVGVSGFDASIRQLPLLLPELPAVDEARRERLDSVLDTLRERFGGSAIMPGRLLGAPAPAKPPENPQDV